RRRDDRTLSDPGAVGLDAAGHPLLRARVDRADGDGVVLTGRLSVEDQPWLADHAVMDTVLLPATGFVELANHAATVVGARRVDELTLHVPLVLPERGGVRVQVVVGAPDADDRRELAVYSRAESGGDDGGERPWTTHATGLLGPGTAGDSDVADAQPDADALATWPPPDAEVMEIAGAYEWFAGEGYAYGPTFQGLRRAWRRGADVFAEVALPDDVAQDADGYHLHPALLDAALHASVMTMRGESQTAVVPFSWKDVRLHGPATTSLRVWLRRVRDDAVAVVVGDTDGRLVASVGAVAGRAVSPEQLDEARKAVGTTAPGIESWRYEITWKLAEDVPVGSVEGLWLTVMPAAFRADAWVHAAGEALTARGARVHAIVVDDDGSGGPSLDRAGLRERIAAACPDGEPVRGVLSWLGLDERMLPSADAVPAGLALSAVLVQALEDADVDAPVWFVTIDAMAAVPGDMLDHPIQSAVWGLGRAVGLEQPRRWGGVVDVPVLACDEAASTVDEQAVGRLIDLLGADWREDQIAIRPSGVYLRRLARSSVADIDAAGGWTPCGTVLVTGGTGALGGHVARWLAAKGATHVVLTSRAGRSAAGAAELERELTELGAQVTIAHCDAADRAQVTELLAALPADPPLTAVIHTAGVSNDGLIDALTPEAMQTVLRSKITGAMNLDELTRDRDLSAFVMFSSVSGVLGTAGQASYGAANTFLDSLVQARRARGLAATSFGWGMWGGGGMAALGSNEERIVRVGIRAMDPQEAMAVMDQAMSENAEFLTVLDVDWRRYVARIYGGIPSPLISDLPELRAARSVAVGAAAAGGQSWSDRLATMSEVERGRALMALVRETVAAVLGFASVGDVAPARAFSELGFDSLAAVELRNKLNAATGLRLPATLIFDYPTPVAVADLLLSELVAEQETTVDSVLAELDRLESVLATLAPEDDEAGLVAARADEILAKVTSGRVERRAVTGAGGVSTEMIESASDDEMFDFINTQLGKSSS
ncbi:SDR family NAD(P)-dependent oxidoreductase, partial [Frankia sp. Cas3]|uniref:SDR family NAD(P)-dependent oxidoreductase n=1 Tax=Frankia sp. Cas3 TaxID=3073926 RepID=UPI002AD42973